MFQQIVSRFLQSFFDSLLDENPALLISLLFLTACGRLSEVGRAPGFTPLEGTYEHHALYSSALPEYSDPNAPTDASSLWTAGRSSLFGDRRAQRLTRRLAQPPPQAPAPATTTMAAIRPPAPRIGDDEPPAAGVVECTVKVYVSTSG